MSTIDPAAAGASAPRRRWGCLAPLIVCLLLSILLNIATGLVYVGVVVNPLEANPEGIEEQFYLGDPDATDKIAIVRVTGVITGAGIQFPVRQLEAAARDPRVKAVVLRIDSPGGTVTASEELYQCIVNLRDNTGRRFRGTGPKPVSVSMGGVAASGGYYVAVAGRPISAEATTITGSIGVFVAIPNVAELGEKHGVKLELIKAGGMKAAGSLFHTLTPEERQTWQDTVDAAYEQFLEVISANRPTLTTKHLSEIVVIDRMVTKRDEKGNPLLNPKGEEIKIRYQRRLADGGTFAPKDALQHRLIDKIEDLPSVVRSAAATQGLGSFKAVQYHRPEGLIEKLTGLPIRVGEQLSLVDQFRTSLTPRLWYLYPTADAGLIQSPN